MCPLEFSEGKRGEIIKCSEVKRGSDADPKQISEQTDIQLIFLIAVRSKSRKTLQSVLSMAGISIMSPLGPVVPLFA